MEQKLMKLHVSPALHMHHQDVTKKLRELTQAMNEMILFARRHVPGYNTDGAFFKTRRAIEGLWDPWEAELGALLYEAMNKDAVDNDQSRPMQWFNRDTKPISYAVSDPRAT